MVTFENLHEFFKEQGYRVIIAADGQTRSIQFNNGKPVYKAPAGGVSTAFDPIAKASSAIYISRDRTQEEKEKKRVIIDDGTYPYTMRRIFLGSEETDSYYKGFSNQTLWPLCHVAFEKPQFHDNWYEGYKKVNQKFAEAIKDEIKGKTFIWINDYHLSLVPYFLNRPKNTIIGFFWHIPWPTWEVFRILPQKKEVLQSLLSCDFLGFHRGYHVRNFLNTVDREFEARTDEETKKVYFNNTITTVENLPLGVDTDVIKKLSEEGNEVLFLEKLGKQIFDGRVAASDEVSAFLKKHILLLGIDRLDYTKGLLYRLSAIDRFFEQNPSYIGKAIYIGVIAPSRESINSYQNVRKGVKELAGQINEKYQKNGWKPIHLIHNVFSRRDVTAFYKHANVCLVTPLDDGMNLVSKEFVIASSLVENPGMLVLSQFAGSAIDLTEALIINPYNVKETAKAIKNAIEMSEKEKRTRIKAMAETLVDRNIYVWAEDFVKDSITAAKENRK